MPEQLIGLLFHEGSCFAHDNIKGVVEMNCILCFEPRNSIDELLGGIE
jgi:hypothetical protein